MSKEFHRPVAKVGSWDGPCQSEADQSDSSTVAKAGFWREGLLVGTGQGNPLVGTETWLQVGHCQLELGKVACWSMPRRYFKMYLNNRNWGRWPVGWRRDGTSSRTLLVGTRQGVSFARAKMIFQDGPYKSKLGKGPRWQEPSRDETSSRTLLVKAGQGASLAGLNGVSPS
jgi:hypothetical protein